MSCGNFLELAESQCGIPVGFGKMILVYKESQAVALSSLTATAIQALITSGDIVGVIKGWHTVAGASVAELSAEHGDSTMNLIKSEIPADTLTFENNISNNKVLKSLVKYGTVNCILLDDLGYAFGEKSLVATSIHTAKFNFSSKVSSNLQNDLTTEQTVMVTVRYLIDEVGYLNAGVEVEDIVSKVPLMAFVSSVTSQVAETIVLVLDLKDETTGDLLTEFVATALAVDAVVNGNAVTAAGVFAANQLTLTLTSTVADFDTTTNKIKLSLSTESYYLTEISFDTSTFSV